MLHFKDKQKENSLQNKNDQLGSKKFQNVTDFYEFFPQFTIT